MNARTVKTQLYFPQLPHYLTIWRIYSQKSDTVTIEVESTIHVNRITKMPNSYSWEFFADRYPEVAGDILSFCIRRYGLELQPTKYI